MEHLLPLGLGLMSRCNNSRLFKLLDLSFSFFFSKIVDIVYAAKVFPLFFHI